MSERHEHQGPPRHRSVLAKLVAQLRREGYGATLARGAGAALILRSIGIAAALGLQVLLARLLAADGYGTYAYAISVLLVLHEIALGGMRQASSRFVPEHLAREEFSLARGFLRRSTQLTLGASVLLAGGVAAASQLLPLRPALAVALLAGALLVPAMTMASLYRARLRALKRIVYSDFPFEVLRPAFLVGGLAALVWWVGLTLSVELAIAATVVVAAVTALVLWRGFRQTCPREVLAATPEFRSKAWLSVSGNMFLFVVLQQLQSQTGVLLLGVMHEPKAVGLFVAASRLAELVKFGLRAINVIAGPMIAELYAVNKTQELQRVLRLAALANLAFVVVVGGGALVAAHHLVRLFGADFAGAEPVLVIILGGQMFNALTGSVGVVLNMTNHDRVAVRLTVMSATLNAVLCVALIPRFSVVGAAIASATTLVVWNVAAAIAARRYVGLDPTVLSLLDRPAT